MSCSSTNCRGTRPARCSSARSARCTRMRTPETRTPKTTETRRRTQAQRRAATRGALLDAALDCLVEEGYANLSTRKVAERAGVSQGTQMHYFPSRATFLAEAVRHVTLKLMAELREHEGSRAGSASRRLAELLDRVWQIHTGPVSQATMELWTAGRTDPEVG